MWRFLFAAVVTGLIGVLSSVPAAAASQNRENGRNVRADLLAGRSVLLPDRTRISGDLNLKGRRVRGPLVCKRCTLSGSIRGAHATFEGTIDLRGATFEQGVDLEDATFLAPVRFGGPADAGRGVSQLALECQRDARAGALFKKNVNLAYATFQDGGDFQQVTFCGDANFTSARFRHAARFTGVDFRARSRFRGAAFEREAVFADGEFGGAVIDFSDAAFGGVADFRRGELGGVPEPDRPETTTFAGSVFRERADFSKTEFSHPTKFDDSRMAADGVFRSATFHGAAAVKPGDYVLSLEQAAIRGRLDFTNAHLEGKVQLAWLSAEAVSFQETTFGHDFRLFAHGILARDLVAKIDSIDPVREEDDRIALLKLLESSAKERGDLRLANQAHFDLQALAARDDWLPRRVVDFALYQNVAGYLVRPVFPLAWLLAIVFVATVLRALRLNRGQPSSADVEAHGKKTDGPGGKRTGNPPPRPRVGLGERVVTAFALTVAGRPEPSPLRRTELVVYSLLIGCIVIALANTNPTLRDMIDTIR